MTVHLRLRSRFIFLGGIFSARLEEWLVDSLGVMEVVVHYVDEVAGVHQLRDHFPRGRIGVIELCPLLPELESLIL